MKRRNKQYYKIIQSKTWKETRNEQLQRQPLCERCKAEGRLKEAQCVHHIKPIEEALSQEEMTRLAFDPINLQSLCYECHKKVHEEMGINSKKRRKEYQDAKVQRILSSLGIKC